MTARLRRLGTRRYRTSLKQRTAMLQTAAMIDIFFLMLFFILIASSVVRISGIKVNLPQAAVPQASDLGRSIVTITPPAEPGLPCRIYYRDRLMADENQFRNELLTPAGKGEKVLVIRADETVPSGLLSRIMAIAEDAKMESFIAVQPLEIKQEKRFD